MSSGLLDLADDFLVAILERVHDLRSIIRFGAVSKRLHRLHFLTSRIITSIKPGEPCEERLLRFLTSLARNGGCLQELKVWSQEFEESEESVEIDTSLGWVEPVATHLRSFELDFTNNIDFLIGIDRFADVFSRSTRLVKLRLVVRCTGILPSQVEQVVASCPSLRVLEISSYSLEEDEMELTSSSLQEIGLASYVTVTLNTPALRSLEISARLLKIRLHSLKRLKLFGIDPVCMISPRLTDLELLWLSGRMQFMENLWRGIEGRCLKALHIEAACLPKDLVSLLKPLTRLTSLEIGSECFQAFLMGIKPKEAAQLLARLGVEEMVVAIETSFVMVPSSVEAIRDLELLLWSLLSGSSPLRKLVVESRSINVDDQESPAERIRLRAALTNLVEQFPGVVSVVDSRDSTCFGDLLDLFE